MSSGYQPLHITGMSTGLVQKRQEFILPDDAYPVLENAYVWRERIKRKQGFQLLGRLRRVIASAVLDTTVAGTPYTEFNILVASGITEPTAQIEPGSVEVTITGGNAANAATYSDDGDGTFTTTGNGDAALSTINYITGLFHGAYVVNAVAPNSNINVAFNYFPGLPVMGLRQKEIVSTNNEQLVAFDTVYAYKFVGTGFQEYLPGTTWTGSDSEFFWSTNYWVGDNNLKIFWVTNFNDPIRYTNGVPGTNWIDFAPQITDPAGTNKFLTNALVMLPFRGRMMAFNTVETDGDHPNRIRWAAIGNPFTVVSAIVTVVSPTAWRDDITGKGGFLDIPTNEDIITVGFVRDNLVIYCERSTWQLRYTGRSIAPFQIEKVNSELGVESTFSGVQFDTSLVGIGDKGIIECDSFKSERIDIKIPDLVFDNINNEENGTKRVHGIRDFQERLAYWTYPAKSDEDRDQPSHAKFPNRRLVYNYENDSWAIFTDSLTTLGTFQSQTNRTWANSQFPWIVANFPWLDRPALFPSIIGGNQQGFVLYLDSQTTNQESLYIQNIQGNTPNPTIITSPDHNLETGDVIKIADIPAGTGYATALNNVVFGVTRTNANVFTIQKYNPSSGQFDDPYGQANVTYIGGGTIRVRDNFSIKSKKFNYIEQGKQFQLGYVDVLFDATTDGAVTMLVFNDYNDTLNASASNIFPLNQYQDSFFNSVVETTAASGVNGGTKNWKRVFCATNANFVTIEWNLNNEQMNGRPQESDVQIDAQIIWNRVGGRMGITN